MGLAPHPAFFLKVGSKELYQRGCLEKPRKKREQAQEKAHALVFCCGVGGGVEKIMLRTLNHSYYASSWIMFYSVSIDCWAPSYVKAWLHRKKNAFIAIIKTAHAPVLLGAQVQAHH